MTEMYTIISSGAMAGQADKFVKQMEAMRAQLEKGSIVGDVEALAGVAAGKKRKMAALPPPGEPGQLRMQAALGDACLGTTGMSAAVLDAVDQPSSASSSLVPPPAASDGVK